MPHQKYSSNLLRALTLQAPSKLKGLQLLNQKFQSLKPRLRGSNSHCLHKYNKNVAFLINDSNRYDKNFLSYLVFGKNMCSLQPRTKANLTNNY